MTATTQHSANAQPVPASFGNLSMVQPSAYALSAGNAMAVIGYTMDLMIKAQEMQKELIATGKDAAEVAANATMQAGKEQADGLRSLADKQIAAGVVAVAGGAVSTGIAAKVSATSEPLTNAQGMKNTLNETTLDGKMRVGGVSNGVNKPSALDVAGARERLAGFNMGQKVETYPGKNGAPGGEAQYKEDIQTLMADPASAKILNQFKNALTDKVSSLDTAVRSKQQAVSAMGQNVQALTSAMSTTLTAWGQEEQANHVTLQAQQEALKAIADFANTSIQSAQSTLNQVATNLGSNVNVFIQTLLGAISNSNNPV